MYTQPPEDLVTGQATRSHQWTSTGASSPCHAVRHADEPPKGFNVFNLI